MNDKSSTSSLEEVTSNILGDRRNRAALVYRDTDGSLRAKPIEQGKSVVNIEQDLLSHLNEAPYSSEWLLALRDYCDKRLAARNEARLSGGVVIQRGDGRMEIAHVAAFQPFNLSGRA